MSNTPSNEDIDLLVRAYLGDCGPQANCIYSFVAAVLAKWGTPQQEAQEPEQGWPTQDQVWAAMIAFGKHDGNIEGMRAALIAGAASQPAPAPLSDREAFEDWYTKRHPTPVNENSTWAHASKMDDWEVWQACAALAAKEGK